MSALEKKAAYLRQLVGAYLEEACASSEPALLYEPVRYLIESGGKRLRPLLLLLAAEAVGADVQEVVPAAAAIELLHTFTLVHDDIMDQDETRRGRPTVHVKWDVGTAILAGDGLVAMAYHALFSRNYPRLVDMARVFTKGIVEVCEGQALDKEFETRSSVGMNEYMTMIRKKTACLFATACQVGALAGDGTDEQVDSLGQYGTHLGIAFQVQDDLLDLSSSVAVSGKPRGSDLAQGKKTFLVVAAEPVMSAQQRAWLAGHFGRHLPGEELDEVERLFRSLGVVAEAEAVVNKELELARQALGSLPPSEAVQAMLELSHQLVARVA
ncbi:MAG: polyprenyl synthetase family protein [candidate division KSB1 bacterium]|nr:polyprenyl synthetase family protein [candidate division KSB1 bacterium]MDZ7385395.1 polyprenyl synthetase family protein [candidate division KSB1 bacterium]MDZ7413939.1 polyprenyl synthetase family protein [candidate division KSB1 bacterium]